MSLLDQIKVTFGNLEGVETVGEILATLADSVTERKSFREIVREWGKHQSARTVGETINIIPFGVPGSCRELLVVFSLGRSQFDERLRQAHDHCAIDCPGITKGIIFITDYWDNETFWDSRSQTFKKLASKYGIIFAVGIWSGKSVSVQQVIP